MRHRFVATILAAFVLVLAAFTGTSLAGNGHGNGGGNSNGASGQSGQTSQPSTAQPTSHGNSSHNSQSKQSSTSPSSPATGGSNANGVKPSSSTKHDTYAKASSDQTKKYGNGKTAGQIATSAGYGDATLHGPGNSQPHKTNCGGHEVDVHALKNKGSKCGETTSQPTVEQHASKHEEQSQKQSQKHEEQSSQQTQQTQSQTQTQGVSQSAEQHVTICHATGSATNPYVRISPSASGVFHGHLGHQDGRDIVPPFTWEGQKVSENWDANGQAVWNNGCAAPATQTQSATEGAQAAQVQTQAPCTTAQTVTEQVLVGVKHFIGPKGSGRYVVIHPSTHSAHYTGKHPDDQPIFETVTKTVNVPASNCTSGSSTESSSSTQSASSAQSSSTQSSTPVVQGAQTAPVAATGVGAVKGASVTLKPAKTNRVAAAATTKPKPAGGVLGATTRLGSTVTSAKLPFTGLPLWIFVAVAAALILTGAAVRRSANERA